MSRTQLTSSAIQLDVRCSSLVVYFDILSAELINCAIFSTDWPAITARFKFCILPGLGCPIRAASGRDVDS